MEYCQSFSTVSCSQTKIEWFEVIDPYPSELYSKSLSQLQTSKTDTNAQAKEENVKYMRIIVEVKVKKTIPQCTKNNASHMVKVFVEQIL